MMNPPMRVCNDGMKLFWLNKENKEIQAHDGDEIALDEKMSRIEIRIVYGEKKTSREIDLEAEKKKFPMSPAEGNSSKTDQWKLCFRHKEGLAEDPASWTVSLKRTSTSNASLYSQPRPFLHYRANLTGDITERALANPADLEEEPPDEELDDSEAEVHQHDAEGEADCFRPLLILHMT